MSDKVPHHVACIRLPNKLAHLRAIVTLAWERKLMGVPIVQINIAAEGGQQVVSNASLTDTAPRWRAG